MIPSIRGWARVATVGLCVLVAVSGHSMEADHHEGGGELPHVDLSGGPAYPFDKHLEAKDITAGKMSFQEIFDAGLAIFNAQFNGYDGVGGMRLPNGETVHRFSITPTAGGPGTGSMLSSQSCAECHNLPFAAGAGLATTNVIADPNGDGMPPYNKRSTISLWANGVLQLLAQEMTEELQAQQQAAGEQAKGAPGTTVTQALSSKGVSYGSIAATADASGNVTYDLAGLKGLAPDLVVRPFGWKGNGTIVRTFSVGASALLMGMQAEELLWQIPGLEVADADADGVERELSVGDITAMTIYNAAQETPQSVERLAELGLVAPPDKATLDRIHKGREAFEAVGCAVCHVPEMRLMNTVFEEPTTRGNGNYYNQLLAAKSKDYDPERPVRFDILKDAQAPRAEAHPDGGAILHLYSDLKRHNMGRHLADPAGPTPNVTANFQPLMWDGGVAMVAPNEFLTPELWGVGNTGPWLHDARAGTLEEAILLHGEDDPAAVGDPGRSEAQESRDAFAALPADEREAVLIFLRSLRTFEDTSD